MASIITPRTPASSGGDEAAFAGVPEIFAMVQRANHATAFAAWVVTTAAMGLVIQYGTIRDASRSPLGWLLFAALVPVVAALVHVVVLLVRANRATGTALREFYRFIAATPPEAAEASVPAWREFQRLSAASHEREALSQRALRWAYGSGIAFLAWSVAAAVLAATG